MVVVTARDEAAYLEATLDALALGFPGAPIVLADDGSSDGTAAVAGARGAIVVGGGRRRGKGAAATSGCRRALELHGSQAIYVLCDGDLGASAAQLAALVPMLDAVPADLAIAAFASRGGGGFGFALAFARFALRRRAGATLHAPISGQRALHGELLAELLPFADGFGMELAMTIDVLRAGGHVVELELELEHRRRGRDLAGFAHRARQLRAFVAVYLTRRRGRRTGRLRTP